MSARVVQRYVVDEFPDERLNVYVVWGPMLEKETEEDVAYATGQLYGPRVLHYWTPSHSLASALERPLGLEEGARAWDTFLLYPPATRWGDEVPEPSYYMHVGKPLPDDRRLNGKKLAAEVGKLLSAD